MKKWLFLVLSLPVLGACKKTDGCTYSEQNVVASSMETGYLQNYITMDSITATQHSSGIFYTIDHIGTGAVANVCSSITVNYVGSLIPSGTVFETVNTTVGVSFALGQVIVGWQKGISLIRAGGQITIYIPPSLGYGPVPKNDEYGNVVIPGNSYLKFVIKLLDVQ
jgi:FKBP-type peptidyl-prolyl cis-trans isomerase FkpA